MNSEPAAFILPVGHPSVKLRPSAPCDTPDGSGLHAGVDVTRDTPQSASAAAPPAPRALREARVVARVLDDLIRVPLTRRTVGLDPLIGLVPGLGDWAGWAASAHLLVASARLGASAPLILRMAVNALLDAVVGSVPVLGDLFDLGWKANRRNLVLLESLVADPAATKRSSRLLVGTVLIVTFGVTALTAVGALLLFRWVLRVSGLPL